MGGHWSVIAEGLRDGNTWRDVWDQPRGGVVSLKQGLADLYNRQWVQFSQLTSLFTIVESLETRDWDHGSASSADPRCSTPDNGW